MSVECMKRSRAPLPDPFPRVLRGEARTGPSAPVRACARPSTLEESTGIASAAGSVEEVERRDDLLVEVLEEQLQNLGIVRRTFPRPGPLASTLAGTPTVSAIRNRDIIVLVIWGRGQGAALIQAGFLSPPLAAEGNAPRQKARQKGGDNDEVRVSRPICGSVSASQGPFHAPQGR